MTTWNESDTAVQDRSDENQQSNNHQRQPQSRHRTDEAGERGEMNANFIAPPGYGSLERNGAGGAIAMGDGGDDGDNGNGNGNDDGSDLEGNGDVEMGKEGNHHRHRHLHHHNGTKSGTSTNRNMSEGKMNCKNLGGDDKNNVDMKNSNSNSRSSLEAVAASPSSKKSSSSRPGALAASPRRRPALLRAVGIRHIDASYHSRRGHRIDWSEYRPNSGSGPMSWLRWIILGYTDRSRYTHAETLDRFRTLAKMLRLLRLYDARYGMPREGGPADRQFVLKDITQRLYSAGAPIWVLGEVLSKTAEGLTGKAAVDIFLLPRRAFIHAPGSAGAGATAGGGGYGQSPPSTVMFRTERGYNMYRMDLIEKVTVRLASFASNTSSVSNVESNLPTTDELRDLAMWEEEEDDVYEEWEKRLSNEEEEEETDVDGEIGSATLGLNRRHKSDGNDGENEEKKKVISEEEKKVELAKEILDLASRGAGLFFFTNIAPGSNSSNRDASREQGGGRRTSAASSSVEGVGAKLPRKGGGGRKDDDNYDEDDDNDDKDDTFWIVRDTERELFSRLASIEATRSIASADVKASKPLYPWYVVALFRVVSSGGACAFWFRGSWSDSLVAGVLAVAVAYVSETKLTRQERILSEVVASLMVGVVTGIISFRWKEETCFGAMALGAVLDLLQGFRVVFAIIEMMSRHTVTGGADLLEGIVFTALISYFLKFGQVAAARIMKEPDEVGFLTCTAGIDERWYFLLVPLASVSWSGLFSPYYDDLFLMGMHGIIAYAVYYGMALAQTNDSLSNFVAALVVTFSAGVVSRFTGRQALGNTVAGLYVLLPGAYLVRALFGDGVAASDNDGGGFVMAIVLNAIVIGLGAWTGTLLCSPTLLGTTRGMLYHHHPKQNHNTGHGAMLYF